MKETNALKAIERIVNERGHGMAVLVDKLNKIRKILAEWHEEEENENI